VPGLWVLMRSAKLGDIAAWFPILGFFFHLLKALCTFHSFFLLWSSCFQADLLSWYLPLSAECVDPT